MNVDLWLDLAAGCFQANVMTVVEHKQPTLINLMLGILLNILEHLKRACDAYSKSKWFK